MISFRHATVLACTGADPVNDATVVIEGAVIKDVLTSARSAAGARGEVIDCGGRTVMPGLIDAHVHVCAVEVDLAAQRRAYPASLLAYAAGTMISEALDQGFTTIRAGSDPAVKHEAKDLRFRAASSRAVSSCAIPALRSAFQHRAASTRRCTPSACSRTRRGLARSLAGQGGRPARARWLPRYRYRDASCRCARTGYGR